MKKLIAVILVAIVLQSCGHGRFMTYCDMNRKYRVGYK